MRKFFASILVITTVLFFIGGLDAKPPSGGFRSGSSFRSSSSTRSSGWGSRSSSSSKPSSSYSSSKSSTSSTWGSKSSTASSAPKSATDVAAYKSAKTSGKAFTTQSAAEADFKAKAATKYTSTYKTEPATRPAHIPQSTNVGGTNVNISYNSQYGGYGYMHPTLGTWMMYDMISDAAMMSTMMGREGYYVGSSPPVAVVGTGWNFMSTFFTLLLVSFIVVVLITILSGMRS